MTNGGVDCSDMINHFFGKVVHSTCIKGDVIDIQVACHLGVTDMTSSCVRRVYVQQCG